MFKRMDLPTEMNEYLVSITPLLGITGDSTNPRFYVITKYITLSSSIIALKFNKEDNSTEITLNILRKKEDPILMLAYKNQPMDDNLLISSEKITPPTYGFSILTLEAKLIETVKTQIGEQFFIYKVVHVTGDFALDPGFNDKVTIAKTIETMAMTAVDSRVVVRKLSK